MKYFEVLSNFFDILHFFWEKPSTERRLASALVVIFLMGIIGIELNRWGWLPIIISKSTPVSHFMAVNLAFTLILVLEVLSMVFLLSCSLAKAMGKQLEILTLIFLRDAFKEVTKLGEPIDTATNLDVVLHIAIYGFTALFIFILIGLYRKVQSGQSLIKDPMDIMSYVICKKVIALFMLFAFVAVVVWQAYVQVLYNVQSNFFANFYTVLIFADILLVLVGQVFMHSFHATFRASGYVVATMLMRLSMSAPVFYDVALGLFAASFCVGITWVTTHFMPESVRQAPSATKVNMIEHEVNK